MNYDYQNTHTHTPDFPIVVITVGFIFLLKKATVKHDGMRHLVAASWYYAFILRPFLAELVS